MCGHTANVVVAVEILTKARGIFGDFNYKVQNFVPLWMFFLHYLPLENLSLVSAPLSPTGSTSPKTQLTEEGLYWKSVLEIKVYLHDTFPYYDNKRKVESV